jgi:hypothetical protein
LCGIGFSTLRATTVIAAVIGKVAFAASGTGIKTPAHSRSSAVGDSPDGTPSRLPKNGCALEVSGQKAAQHVNDGSGHAGKKKTGLL